MRKGYNAYYLDSVTDNLGEMTDYASSIFGLGLNEYWELFIASGIAREIENGNPCYLSGLSGTELVFEVLSRVGYEADLPEVQTEYEYSAEYWCGWISGYCQWKTGRSFEDIYRILPISEIYKMYPVYHEMPEESFIEFADELFQKQNERTRLQQIRRLRGYSQRILAEKSGINLRTLQQYETGAKNINKAAAGSLYLLASVLDCKMTDLMEML